MKDYTEQQKQMMLQFRTKEVSQKSTLLNFWGRAAAANPAPKPIPAEVQPEPVVVQTTQDVVPITSSKGKLLDSFYPALFNKLILKEQLGQMSNLLAKVHQGQRGASAAAKTFDKVSPVIVNEAQLTGSGRMLRRRHMHE